MRTLICLGLVLSLFVGVIGPMPLLAWGNGAAPNAATAAKEFMSEPGMVFSDSDGPLTVYKSVDETTVSPGSDVVFNVTVEYNPYHIFYPPSYPPSYDAFYVSILDELPSNVAFVSVSDPRMVYDSTDETLSYAGPMDGFAWWWSYSYSFTVKVASCTDCYGILYSETTVHASNGYLAAVGTGAIMYPSSGSLGIDRLNIVVAAGDNDLGPSMVDLFQKLALGAAPKTKTIILLDGPRNGNAYYYEVQSDASTIKDCPTAEDPTCGGRYAIGRNAWKWGEKVSSYSSLYTFLYGAIEIYKPQLITLSLVGHGNGWSPSLIYDAKPELNKIIINAVFHDGKPDALLIDYTPQSWLGTKVLGQVLRDVTLSTGKRIDLLYLDMCLTATTEVAYEVRDSVDYVLASQSWSWTSSRYDLHFAIDAATPPALLAQMWMQNEATELDGSSGGQVYPFAFSLVNTHALDGLLAKESLLADALKDSLSLPWEQAKDNRYRIHAAFIDSACFDSDEDHKLVPNDVDDTYCDVLNFAKALQAAFNEPDNRDADNNHRKRVLAAAIALEQYITDELNAAIQQNNACLPADPEHCWGWPQLGGLNLYMPLGAYDGQQDFYTADQLQSAADGSWDEFLNAYWIGNWCPGCEIPYKKYYLPFVAR